MAPSTDGSPPRTGPGLGRQPPAWRPWKGTLAAELIGWLSPIAVARSARRNASGEAPAVGHNSLVPPPLYNPSGMKGSSWQNTKLSASKASLTAAKPFEKSSAPAAGRQSPNTAPPLPGNFAAAPHERQMSIMRKLFDPKHASPYNFRRVSKFSFIKSHSLAWSCASITVRACTASSAKWPMACSTSGSFASHRARIFEWILPESEGSDS
mmetsp:Transcript_96307/g.277374  ORF Transcript_96307/g.277374 Transcript_96307/m.277374 type:complete len:210 (+) Transcript_96307:53-682(+)